MKIWMNKQPSGISRRNALEKQETIALTYFGSNRVADYERKEKLQKIKCIGLHTESEVSCTV